MYSRDFFYFILLSRFSFSDQGALVRNFMSLVWYIECVFVYALIFIALYLENI